LGKRREGFRGALVNGEPGGRDGEGAQRSTYAHILPSFRGAHTPESSWWRIVGCNAVSMAKSRRSPHAARYRAGAIVRGRVEAQDIAMGVV
jgi:hypothetical protein